VGSTPFTDTVRNVTAALLAIGMGIQNAVARRLAVPDLTTTVLTMTLTGLAADVRSGTNLTVLLRRLAAVAAMLGGGVLGAELVLHTSAAVTLGIAAGPDPDRRRRSRAGDAPTWGLAQTYDLTHVDWFRS
jgi:uncharacterized membrane protein YoaK (UPF0700 family)